MKVLILKDKQDTVARMENMKQVLEEENMEYKVIDAKKADISQEVLDMMFPNDDPDEIPPETEDTTVSLSYDRAGFPLLQLPEHPFCDANGFIQVHRLVMEEVMLRIQPDSSYLVRVRDEMYLAPNVPIKHLDGDICNFSPENLEICAIGDMVINTCIALQEQIDAESALCNCPKCQEFRKQTENKPTLH